MKFYRTQSPPSCDASKGANVFLRVKEKEKKKKKCKRDDQRRRRRAEKRMRKETEKADIVTNGRRASGGGPPVQFSRASRRRRRQAPVGGCFAARVKSSGGRPAYYERPPLFMFAARLACRADGTRYHYRRPSVATVAHRTAAIRTTTVPHRHPTPAHSPSSGRRSSLRTASIVSRSPRSSPSCRPPIEHRIASSLAAAAAARPTAADRPNATRGTGSSRRRNAGPHCCHHPRPVNTLIAVARCRCRRRRPALK